jgi:hypothetical protein
MNVTEGGDVSPHATLEAGSSQVAYSRGSQQQSVTGFPDGDDGNSLWLVQGPVVSAYEVFM